MYTITIVMICHCHRLTLDSCRFPYIQHLSPSHNTPIHQHSITIGKRPSRPLEKRSPSPQIKLPSQFIKWKIFICYLIYSNHILHLFLKTKIKCTSPWKTKLETAKNCVIVSFEHKRGFFNILHICIHNRCYPSRCTTTWRY